MTKLFQISLVFCLAATAAAQEQVLPKVLWTFDWKDLSAQIPNSQIVSTDGVSVLKVVKTNDTPLEISLLTITNSSLVQKANAIEWEMKYENVYLSTNKVLIAENRPRLEFYETFPPRAVGGDSSTNREAIYFYGTKNWDMYEFPITPAYYDNETRPKGLSFRLSWPASGTIYLRPIKLLGWASSLGGWWSPQQAGLVGGIGGSVIGCLGGLLGVLAGLGKARRFVLAMAKVFIALGILLLIAGVVAIAAKQPYAVYYPPLLMGFILTLVFSVNLPSIRRRYDELEIRRMTSIDATGG